MTIAKVILDVLVNRGVAPTERQLANCIYAVISLQIRCPNNGTMYIIEYLFGEDDELFLVG